MISFSIRAQRPCTLGMIAYDPLRPRTDYLRRKIPFTAKTLTREIELPLPVSPRLLKVALSDLHHPHRPAFTLEGITAKPLPQAEVWASPERHSFMDFAIDFAQKAGYVQPGFYPSPDHNFLIQYLPAITDREGNELLTPARIHRQMPRIQLSARLIRRLSIPVRVAILSHEGCHWFLNTRSEKQADLCGIKYYLDYGFPTIEAIYAATKVFGEQPGTVGQQHLDRVADIMAFIDHYTANSHLQHPAA